MLEFIKQFLFIDQKNGNISHTKFWSQVGYFILCWAFIYVTLTDRVHIPIELWVLFGTVVVGNRTVNKALNIFGTNKDNK